MRLGSLSGIIMYRDTELCSFEVKNDVLISYKPLGVSDKYTPWEFRNGYTAATVLDWLKDRLPEDNRQGLYESCCAYGIHMIGSEILKISNGREIGDRCWIKFPTGPQTSKEVFAILDGENAF